MKEVSPPDVSRASGARAIFTIGHSTHALGQLVSLLQARRVAVVADVRAFPGSRRMPHFGREQLERSLPREGIEYLHLSELGGRRRALSRSPNGGWRNDSFRGYADHMQSGDFQAGLRRVEELARERRTALMCAEALWWRCHRRLIADAMAVRGWTVVHIAPDGTASAHVLTPFAAVNGTRVTYPSGQPALDDSTDGRAGAVSPSDRGGTIS